MPDNDTPPITLTTLFSPDQLIKTIKRIGSRRDTEDLITHPLKRAVLNEYRRYLARLIAREVAGGGFTPARAYSCTVSKPSGGLRHLVFPSLLDSIVARHTVDAVESEITHDDHERAFCGRSKASTKRPPGDYDSWFDVWRDFTSSIAQACQESGYAYVFETDVADFFPSIDRVRARTALEKRTTASSGISALLFHCLEAWLVRYGYEKGPGLPVEPHDVSRLLAHNYLKTVDMEFPTNERQLYLRFVDDTVVFVKTESDAHRVMRHHHAALSLLGLSPNSAKTNIISTHDYENQRHVETNRRIDLLDQSFDETEFSTLLADWYTERGSAPNWSRVTKRLYTLARTHKSALMRTHALDDLRTFPELTDHSLRYLSSLSFASEQLSEFVDLWNDPEIHSERLIGVSKFLCNLRSDCVSASKTLSDFAVYRIRREDDRPAASYARALLLLLLYKHANRDQREKVFYWGANRPLIDPQIRHHFLYVFTAAGNVNEDVMHEMRPLLDTDTELTLRICRDAQIGALSQRKQLLDICTPKGGTIEARYLPLLHIMLSCDNFRQENAVWIEKRLSPIDVRQQIQDRAVTQFLKRILERIAS